MYSFVSYSYMETKIIERRKKWKEKGKSSIARMVCATATSSMEAKHTTHVAVDRKRDFVNQSPLYAAKKLL